MNCYFEFDKNVFCLAKLSKKVLCFTYEELYGFYESKGASRLLAIGLLKLVIWIANLS